MIRTRFGFRLAILCYVGIFTSVLGCVEGGDAQDRNADSERAAVQIIARLYRGGPILTMAGESPEIVEALLERDGRILFVGGEAEARRFIEDEIQIVDLDGQTLLPGFIDTHVHYGVQAQALSFEVAPPWRFESDLAFIDHVAAVAERTPKGEWIVLYGYDRVLIPPYRNLTRTDLDRATRDHPVLVLYLGLHWASTNSLGLEAAGIDRETPTHIQGGGIYFKDEAGEPTGLMTESAVFGLVDHIESMGDPLDPIARREIAKRMSANGITTIADRATGATGGPQELALLEMLAHEPDFPLRIVATPIYQILGLLDGPTAWDGAYQATQIKLLIDASLVGGTSATLDPQLDGTTGNLNYSRAEYRRALLESAAKGFSTATHTMGDRGHRVMLDVFEEIRDEVLPVGRHSIEHSALVADEDIPRIAALGLSVSQLTPLLHVHGDAMAQLVYGEARARRLFDSARIDAAGINLALHSDAPIFESRPLQYVWVAVNRITTSGRVLGPEARLTPYRALRGITINAARHLSLEHELGSLEVGKRADFVVLDENPLSVDPAKIDQIEVRATIKGGRRYFDIHSAASATGIGMMFQVSTERLPSRL